MRHNTDVKETQLVDVQVVSPMIAICDQSLDAKSSPSIVTTVNKHV